MVKEIPNLIRHCHISFDGEEIPVKGIYLYKDKVDIKVSGSQKLFQLYDDRDTVEIRIEYGFDDERPKTSIVLEECYVTDVTFEGGKDSDWVPEMTAQVMFKNKQINYDI